MNKNRMKEDWLGVSYPYVFQNIFVWKLWKNLFCPMGWHLFDEVQSIDEHYLSCDACDAMVHISRNNLSLSREE